MRRRLEENDEPGASEGTRTPAVHTKTFLPAALRRRQVDDVVFVVIVVAAAATAVYYYTSATGGPEPHAADET